MATMIAARSEAETELNDFVGVQQLRSEVPGRAHLPRYEQSCETLTQLRTSPTSNWPTSD